MGTPNFGAPPPFDYDPPSVLSRYRGLLILFLVVFVGIVALSRHIIRERREQPIPPGPVYLQNLEVTGR